MVCGVSWVNFSREQLGRTTVYIKLVQYLWAKTFVCGETCWTLIHNSNVEQNVEDREVNRVSNKEAGRNIFKKISMFAISGTFSKIFSFRDSINSSPKATIIASSCMSSPMFWLCCCCHGSYSFVKWCDQARVRDSRSGTGQNHDECGVLRSSQQLLQEQPSMYSRYKGNRRCRGQECSRTL